MARRVGMPPRVKNGVVVDVLVACEDLGKAARRALLTNYTGVQAERELIGKTLAPMPAGKIVS